MTLQSHFRNYRSTNYNYKLNFTNVTMWTRTITRDGLKSSCNEYVKLFYLYIICYNKFITILNRKQVIIL